MQKQEKAASLSPVYEVCGAALARRPRERYPEELSKWFAVLMLGVFPLVISPDKYYNITRTKFEAFRILQTAYAVLAVLLLLDMALLNRERLQKRRADGMARPSLPQLLLLAYVACTCVSALLSPYRGSTWLGMARYEGVCATLLYCGAFLMLSRWAEYTHLYLYVFAASMTVLSLIGVLQPLGIDFLSPEGDWFAVRFTSTIGNIDVFSGLIALAVPIFGGVFVVWKDRRRWLFAVPYCLLICLQELIDVDSGRVGLTAALIVALPLLCTDWARIGRVGQALGLALAALAAERFVSPTEAGLMLAADRRMLLFAAAAAALLAGGLLLARVQKPMPVSKKALRIAIILALVVCIAAALMWIASYEGKNRTLRDFSALLHGTLEDSAGTNRGYIWKSTAGIIAERPLLGGGPGTFERLFEPYNGRYQELMRDDNIYVDFAHNDYLQIAAERGLIALAVYLAFLAALGVRALRRADRFPMLAALLIGCVGFWAHMFFAFSIGILSPIFWVLAGVMEKAVRQLDEAADGKRMRPPAEAKKTDVPPVGKRNA